MAIEALAIEHYRSIRRLRLTEGGAVVHRMFSDDGGATRLEGDSGLRGRIVG